MLRGVATTTLSRSNLTSLYTFMYTNTPSNHIGFNFITKLKNIVIKHILYLLLLFLTVASSDCLYIAYTACNIAPNKNERHQEFSQGGRNSNRFWGIFR